VPAPGASNVVKGDFSPTKGVLLKFRKPLLVPLEAVGARIPCSKIEIIAAASKRAGANRFVRCVVMFFSLVEFFMTRL
jgi:hypothetical protein